MTGPTASGLDPHHAPSIECLEVREALSASSRGLTEWALVQAHVARCPDCQKQRESLRLAVGSQRVESFPGAMLAASVATSIARARVLIARAPHLLMPLRSSSATTFRGTVRGAREAAGARATRVLGLLSRLGALAAIARTPCGRAGARLVERAGATFTRVGRRMPPLVAPLARAVGHAIGRARLAITRVPHAVIGLCAPLTVGVRTTTHAARQTAGAGAARAVGLLSRLRAPLTVAVRSTTHAIRQTARAGVARGLGRLDRLGVRASSLARSTARAIGDHPRAYAAIAGLAVLVPSLLFLWPRQGPDDLVPRLSGRGRLSREISAPVDRKPAEPAAPVPFVVTASPRPGAGAPPAPVVAPRPEPSSVTVSHLPAEVPAPVRRRATAAAPPPSGDAPGNAEAADATAAIDWLLQGGRSRRQAESP